MVQLCVSASQLEGLAEHMPREVWLNVSFICSAWNMVLGGLSLFLPCYRKAPCFEDFTSPEDASVTKKAETHNHLSFC